MSQRKDQTEAPFVKRPAKHAGEVGFFPTDEDDSRAYLAGFEMHGEGLLSFDAEVNMKQFRLFWKILSLVAANKDDYQGDSAAAKNQMMLDWKEADMWMNRLGQMQFQVRSVSPKRIGQARFALLFERMVKWASNELGNSPDEIREELYRLVDGPRG